MGRNRLCSSGACDDLAENILYFGLLQMSLGQQEAAQQGEVCTGTAGTTAPRLLPALAQTFLSLSWELSWLFAEFLTRKSHSLCQHISKHR